MWDYDNSKFDYTMTELKRIGIKRIIILGPLVRWGVRGLPNNVIDYYYKDAHHSPMPDRTTFRSHGGDLDIQIRQKLMRTTTLNTFPSGTFFVIKMGVWRASAARTKISQHGIVGI